VLVLQRHHRTPIRSIQLLFTIVRFAEGRVKHRPAGVAPAVACISLKGTLGEVDPIQQTVERGILQ